MKLVQACATLLICTSVCNAASLHTRRRVDSRLFKPSPELQPQQNAVIDRLGLLRIKDETQLQSLVKAGELQPLASTGSLVINDKLPSNRRYCRPWVNTYLLDLSTKWQRWFPSTPLVVTSAVRTEQVQRRLLRFNRNAAPVHGEKASSHLAGTTVDIARRKLTRAQTQTLEQLLRGYRDHGQAIVLEERAQMCFHVMWIPKEQQ